MFETEETERAFWKLLSTLTRNVSENAAKIKKINPDLDQLKALPQTSQFVKQKIVSIKKLADELLWLIIKI